MCLVRVTVLATSFILVTAPALAQAPQVEKNVSMALSMAIMQGVLDQCTKDGYKVSVVIIDKGGNVAASVRGDGTPPHTMDFARMKAYAYPQSDFPCHHEADGRSRIRVSAADPQRGWRRGWSSDPRRQ